MKKLMLLSILMVNLTSLGGCPGGSLSCGSDSVCAAHMGPGARCRGGFFEGCCKAPVNAGCFNKEMCDSGHCDRNLPPLNHSATGTCVPSGG